MMKRQNIRTLFLIIGTFTYLLCGASFFDYAESRHETHERTALNRIEKIIIDKYNISQTDFRVLTTVIIKNVPHKAGVQWKFSGAFYFATTVLTTIGYGHSTPATYLGKSFCMLYALMGIPLGLIMFQSIGERLNTFVAFSLRFCKRCLHFEKSEITDTSQIPLSDKCLIISVSVISTLVMTIGAAVFSHWENWSYFDAFYYCFITLTTIGFGDYVALQKNSALQDKPEYVIFSLVFILFGLSVVSAAINLLVLRFLTMNTEDEKRDEAEAALTAASGIKLEGDVITANGSIISGMMPMENYLHNTSHTNSVYPAFTNSRYHVYNYQSNIKHNKNFTNKFNINRTIRLEQDDLLNSDQEYLDDEELELARQQRQDNLDEQNSELIETETNSSFINRALNRKQFISDTSGSERTFNTLKNLGSANLSYLKAHPNSEQSEISFSSDRLSQQHKSKRRSKSKVFCKTSNNLLSKQQRKKYKHMISDDSESEHEMNSESQIDEYDGAASVCSCTCYGGNNSSQNWKSKQKKTKKLPTNQQLEQVPKNQQQTFILNRKSPPTKLKHKNQNMAKSARISNLKAKNIKSINRLNRNQEQFDLNQLQNLETSILRPSHFNEQRFTHLTTTPLINKQLQENQLNAEIFPLNLNICLNNENLEQQILQQSLLNDETLIKQPPPFMIMQHNQPDQFNNLHHQLICNLDTIPNSDYILNQLNTLNNRNLNYFLNQDASQLNFKTTKDNKGQIIELNEKTKQLKLVNKLKDRKKYKNKSDHQPTNNRLTKFEGSSEYLLKRSNEEVIKDSIDEQKTKKNSASDSLKPIGNQKDKQGIQNEQDNIKLSSQRASI